MEEMAGAVEGQVLGAIVQVLVDLDLLRKMEAVAEDRQTTLHEIINEAFQFYLEVPRFCVRNRLQVSRSQRITPD